MTFSYLEFGEIDTKSNAKKVWDFRTGTRAYEWLMGARYLNDILGYKKMENCLSSDKKLINLFSKYIHHKDDVSRNFDKLFALWSTSGNSFFELGSSLFGCIEGTSFCEKLVQKRLDTLAFWHVGNLEEIDWYGLDNSSFMNETAVLTHPRYKITAEKKLEVKTDVFFAKGISLLYAIRKPKQLLDIINRSKISVFDYSFSLKGLQTTTCGSGKPIFYLELGDFGDLIQKAYINRNTVLLSDNRITFDVVYGKNVKDFIGFDSSLYKTKLLSKSIKSAFKLDVEPKWMKLNEYLDSTIGVKI